MTLYARVMTYGLFAGIVLTVPIWPPMLTIMTGQFKHTRRYFTTIRKGFTHLNALMKTRAIHRYFSGQGDNKPTRLVAEDIGGFCNPQNGSQIGRVIYFGEENYECMALLQVLFDQRLAAGRPVANQNYALRIFHVGNR